MPDDQQTFDFLKGEWYAAGGPMRYADVAAAIALAESNGCQYALAGPVDIRPVKTCTWTVTNRENSCGYWQINLRAHPQYSAPAIFNAAANAAAAVAISNHGSDFGAWTTYRDGAYLTYLREFGGGTVGPPPPPRPPQGATGADQRLTADHGWSSLMRAMSRTAPRNIKYAHTMRGGIRRLTRVGR